MSNLGELFLRNKGIELQIYLELNKCYNRIRLYGHLVDYSLGRIVIFKTAPTY